MLGYAGFTPDGCGRAASSQGGLVSDQIQPQHEASSLDAGFEGESQTWREDACFALFCLIIHGCLEKVLNCVSRQEIAAWATPLVLDFDFIRFYEHMWAREGWRNHILIPHSGIDCRQIEAAPEAATLLPPAGIPATEEPSGQTTEHKDKGQQDAVDSAWHLHSGILKSNGSDIPPFRSSIGAKSAMPHWSPKVRRSTEFSSDPNLTVPQPAGQTAASPLRVHRDAVDGPGPDLCVREKPILILYSFYEGPRAARSLRTFLEQTRQDWRANSGTCLQRPSLELVLIISGSRCSVQLPVASNIRVLPIDNTGSDFGAYTEALALLGIRAGSSFWKQLYSYFFFINSSCRGPFLPVYASNLHWTQPFTSKITDTVKLVGPSIHFIPGSSANCVYFVFSPLSLLLVLQHIAQKQLFATNQNPFGPT